MIHLYWYGSGGCTMLVFQGGDQSFTVLSSSTLVRPPVTVSNEMTNGRRDLLLTVSGGGMVTKTVALKFDGSRYPANPSMQPALPDGTTAEGTVLFPEGTTPEPLIMPVSQNDLNIHDEPAMPVAARYSAFSNKVSVRNDCQT